MRLVSARLGKVFSIGSLLSVWAIVIAVALVAQVRPASADEVEQGQLKVKLTQSGSETVVMAWRGTIAAPMATQIKEVFETHRSRAARFVLVLDSGGGSVAEGERVIEVLRRMKQTHELMTAVNHGSKCGSMCVFIFVQGHERVGALTSAWLFHEVSRSDPNTKQITMLNRPRWEELIDKYFRPAGVSEAWIADMKQYTFESDYWQTGADLIQSRSGIINKPLGNQRPRTVVPPTAGRSSSAPLVSDHR